MNFELNANKLRLILPVKVKNFVVDFTALYFSFFAYLLNGCYCFCFSSSSIAINAKQILRRRRRYCICNAKGKIE